MTTKKKTTKKIKNEDISKEFREAAENLNEVLKDALGEKRVREAKKYIGMGFEYLVKGINAVGSELKKEEVRQKIRQGMYKGLKKVNEKLEKKKAGCKKKK